MTEHTADVKDTANLKVKCRVVDVDKTNKVLGIIIAILMIAFGVVLFGWPIETGSVLAYIAAAILIIYGVYQLIVFARTDPERRHGWVLAIGIIFAVLGILLMIAGPRIMLETFVFILAFLALFGGISNIVTFVSLKRTDTPRVSWILVVGIINIVLGVLMIIMPLGFIEVLEFFIAIFFVVGGAALLIEVLSGHIGRKV